MSLIVPPTRTIDLQTTSKRVLGEIINRQSDQLRMLEQQRRVLRNLLYAMVTEPAALNVEAPGRVTITVAAVQRAEAQERAALHLHQNRTTHVFELTAQPSAEAAMVDIPELERME